MPNYSKMVVGVPETDHPMRQSQMLGEFVKGMEVVALCESAKDAEIVRREWQRRSESVVYSVLDI